jgi:hypothetical protein
MVSGMTAARQNAVRLAERRRARVERLADFGPVAFGPATGNGVRVVARREAGEPRRLGDLRQIARWIGRHQQPAQVVIALMVIAASMLAMVIGMLVGAGVEPWLAP